MDDIYNISQYHSLRTRKREDYEMWLGKRNEIIRQFDERTVVLNEWHDKYDKLIERYISFSSEEYIRRASTEQVGDALFRLLDGEVGRSSYLSELHVALAGVMAELTVASYYLGRFECEPRVRDFSLAPYPEVCKLAIPHAVGWLVSELEMKPNNWKRKQVFSASALSARLHTLLEEYSYVKV